MQRPTLPSLIILSLMIAATGCKTRPPKPNFTSGKDQGASTDTPGVNSTGTASGDSTGTTPGGTVPGASTAGTGSTPGGGTTSGTVGTQTGTTTTKTGTTTTTTSTGPAPIPVEQSPHYDEVSWLTAHNAHVNPHDLNGYPAYNQIKGLTDQLNDGVRALMIDVWPEATSNNILTTVLGGKTASGDPVAILSHNQPGTTASFGKSANLPDKLKDIGNWVSSHPDDIVTVFLEDYVSTKQLSDALNQADVFKNQIFNPYSYGVMDKGWPRLDELKKMGKRLIVFSDHSDKKDLGIGFGQDFTNENYWSLGLKGDDITCKTRWDNHPLDERGNNKHVYLLVMNHFRDAPSNLFSKSDNTIDNLRSRFEAQCLPAAKRRVNFLAVDNYDEADWGARKMVEEWNNTMGAALYKDGDFGGDVVLLKPGKYLMKDLKIGDNQLSSMRVFWKARVKLYDDNDCKTLLVEAVNDMRDLKGANDKTSCLTIER